MSKEVRELAGDEIKARILLQRYGKPEEIAYAVWFLASALRELRDRPGAARIDGGFKME